jgi:dihydropyrimidinase
LIDAPSLRTLGCASAFLHFEGLVGSDDHEVKSDSNGSGSLPMSVLIKNGRVVTAADDYRADVFVDGETVALIGKDLDIEADEIIDATDRLVIPGGIDPHTHFDMPFGGTFSADDFETGTRAAAHGGTTTIIDFAIQQKGQSTIEALDTWHAKAEGKTLIDYGFHMIITDMEDDRLSEMSRLASEGVTSYKMFMAYPGVFYVDDGTIFRAMRQAGKTVRSFACTQRTAS